jgi:hypothetical protein
LGEARGVNPYVFLVGCPRSGTTLLLRIGDSHRELAIVGELHWLPRYWHRRVGITPEGFVTRDLLDTLTADRRFPKLDLAPERVADLLADGRPKHFARFVTEVFDLHGQVKGKLFVGEKTPGYVRSLPTIHALWPNAKVVHLIRDGRDVTLSVLEWSRAQRLAAHFPTWEEDPVVTTALWWELHVRLGREAGALLGTDRYHELRYESLVSDPERACAALCAFLGVAYDPAMLRFHEKRTRPTSGLSAKKAWQPITPGLRSWREQMEPNDLRRFEAAAGELLEELGYPTGTTTSGDDLARATELRAAFARHARSRRRRVPDAWGEAA